VVGAVEMGNHARTMLKRSGDSGHPCLVPDFRGNGFSKLGKKKE
jgi:hypothetical protein